MNWLYYLLEANLYLVVFYGFYKISLHQETFNNSNRYYLLITSLFSFVIPFLQIGFLKPSALINEVVPIAAVNYSEEHIIPNEVQHTTDFSAYLYPIYIAVALCFAIKLCFDLSRIIKLWLKAKKQRSGDITVIELQEQTAFSFFNLLFIHPHLAEKETVFNHEMVHIKQKHSFDILFFELMQVICWFNPIIYFIKKDIKLLHEYIADEHSTNAVMQKHEYAMFLIENSFGIMPTALTNQFFNQSILKSRINMLNKKRTAGWARLKFLLALPLMGGMLCVSTVAFTKEYGYIDLLPEKSEAINALFQDPPAKATQSKVQEVTKPDKPKVQQPPKVKSTKVPGTPPKKSTKIAQPYRVVEDRKNPPRVIDRKNPPRVVEDKVRETRAENRQRDSIRISNLQAVRITKANRTANRDSIRVINLQLSATRAENAKTRQRVVLDSVKRINLKLKPTKSRLKEVRIEERPHIKEVQVIPTKVSKTTEAKPTKVEAIEVVPAKNN